MSISREMDDIRSPKNILLQTNIACFYCWSYDLSLQNYARRNLSVSLNFALFTPYCSVQWLHTLQLAFPRCFVMQNKGISMLFASAGN
jgi:hypothetical protein